MSGNYPIADLIARRLMEDEINKKYHVNIERENGANHTMDFSREELNHLNRALSRLSQSEIDAIRGYTFSRYRDPIYDKRLHAGLRTSVAQAHQTNEANALCLPEQRRISVYDKTFKLTGQFKYDLSKLGPRRDCTVDGSGPDDLWHYHSEASLLHEIGHAVRYAPAMRLKDPFIQAQNDHNNSLRKYNEFVKQYNRTDASGQKSMESQLKSLEQDYQAAKKLMDQREKAYTQALNRPTAAIERYYKAGAQRCTSYERKNLEEGIAESFVMRKLDQKASRLRSQSINNLIGRLNRR